MKEKYMGGFSAKDKGNIFCVHRERAGLAGFAYDVLSFPMMIEAHLNSRQGKEESRAVASSKQKLRQQLDGNAAPDPTLLTAVYVNIRPFCNPWPRCVDVHSNLTQF